MKRIYFDHNATTKPSQEVQALLMDWLENWGNSSSIHASARGPKALLRWTRQSLATALNTDPLELIFTSGGSESNNLALKGFYFKNKNSERQHYLLSRVEHPSVTKAMGFLKSQGASVEFIEVDRNGQIDLEKLEKQITDQTALVSVMLANNETGHVFPIKEITKLAHLKGARVHTDATQALGKLKVDLKDLDVDMATFSGHKFYALKGSGILYVKRGVSLEPLVHGGGQERNRRAGTENVLAIASLGVTVQKLDQLQIRIEKMTSLRNLLETTIVSRISGVKVTGQFGERLCNTSSLVIEGVDGETLLMNLDMENISVSTGAACSSGSQEPSPALLAMGLSRQEAQSSLRLSIGWETTQEEIEFFCQVLERVVARIRSFREVAL